MKRAAVLVLAGLLLSACGSIHPGAAAEVDGQTISMKQLDREARTGCTLAKAQQSGQQVSNLDVRRNAAYFLVIEKAAAKIIKERDLPVDRSAVDLAPTDIEAITKAIGDDAGKVIRSIERQNLIRAELTSIGADESDEAIAATNSQQLAQAGQQYVESQFDRLDVSFAPRLGITANGGTNANLGSLSVLPKSDQDTTAGQSALLRCS